MDGVERLLIAGVVIAVAVVIAIVIDRRAPDVPTAPRWAVPTQLDRADFAGPSQPWLVAVFTSETCDACAGTAAKAAVLERQALEADPTVLPAWDPMGALARRG